ncbi:MAG: hypothetical protein Q8P76_03340 [bacterium]|nr:hypothetical protein [bacterium]
MKNDFKALLALIATYTIGNFLLLLNRGLYWDAWQWMALLEKKEYSPMWSLTEQSRLYTHYFLLRPLEFLGDPIFLVNLISFMSWLLAGLCLYGILRKKLDLPVSRAFFISACFILIPTLLIKTGQSILHYSVNNLLFFLAAFLYFIAEKNKRRLFTILNYSASWVLFFLSFLTNSFLVFYGGFLFLIFMFYRRENTGQLISSTLWPWFKNNFLFILLPIIFWGFKISFLVPWGDFAGYNQFISLSADSLTQLIHNLWQNIAYGFFWPILAPLAILPRKIFAGILLLTFVSFYFITKKIFLSGDSGIEFPAKKYWGFGLLLLILGMIPYLLVGKAPQIFGYGFAMRHALLLPLGSSLIILGAILAIVKDRWQTLLQVLILALFSTFTIYNYYWLDMDWYKQQAIIESLKEAGPELTQNASLLVFYDKAGIRWQNRNITSGEYLNYVQRAWPDNNIELVSAGGDEPAAKYQYSIPPGTGTLPTQSESAEKTVNLSITSESTNEILTVANWLTIKRLEIFSTESILLETIKNIYQIKISLL